MTGIQRTIGILFIWAVLAAALFYALGSSLFLPAHAVIIICVALVGGGTAATYFITRVPKVTH